MENTTLESVVRLVLFDFDGTITRKDSLLAFIEFTHGKLILYFTLGLFSPLLLAMYLQLISRSKVKERLLSFLYKGKSRDYLEEKGEQFCQRFFDALMHPQALKKIAEFRENSYRLIIITASAEFWVRPFAKKLGMELIATKLSYHQNIFTGYFATLNCRGMEKKRRLESYLNTGDYQEIIAFGNSKGDLAMYQMAHQSFHRVFK